MRKTKAKVKLELNLARDNKENKKGLLFWHVNQKRKAKKCVHTPINSGGKLVTTAEEKAEIVNYRFHRITE